MLALMWIVLVAAAAHGYGTAIARRLKLDLPTRLERLTIQCGLGLGFLMVFVFVVGLGHVIGRRLSLAMVLPATAFGLWSVVASSGTHGSRIESRQLRLWLSAALAISVVANIIGALAPPSFVDALFYHLVIPREYVRSGGIIELPYIWESYQPLGVEMLFTLGFSLQGAAVAALVPAGLGILAAAATWLLGRRIAGPAGGLLAAAIFYCTAMVAWESTSCFVELGITAFSTLGFYAVLRWSDDESLPWLVVAAILLGVAGTCKLTAIQFPLLASGLVGWISWRSGRGIRIALRRSTLIVGVALVLCVPWYVHSYLWTGNPFYPFAPKLFGENPDYGGVWMILSHYGPGHRIIDLLLAPWRLFANGALFECGQYLSPLPFIVGPLIVLRLKEGRDRQVLMGAICGCFILWLASAHIARYLIPLQPLLAVLAAEALCWFAAGSRYRRRLLVLTATLLVGFGTASTLLYLKTFAPVVWGRESVDSYLGRTAMFYTTYRMVMADVPESALVMTNQGATYYLDRPHVRVRDAEFRGGPDRLAKIVLDGGYTHILVHGQADLESRVAALGPRVRLLWHRDVDVAASRSFGGTIKLPAALFKVLR